MPDAQGAATEWCEPEGRSGWGELELQAAAEFATHLLRHLRLSFLVCEMQMLALACRVVKRLSCENIREFFAQD